MKPLGTIAALVIAWVVLALPFPGEAAEYKGPIIDAHSHVPDAKAIDAYVAAMARHGITKVVLLGVGGVQKQDPEWIGAATRKHATRVVAGVPLPDPTSERAASEVDAAIAKTSGRAIGEVHIRQVSRKIERDPSAPAFARVLEVAAKHRVPVVIHDELDDGASAALEKALEARRNATIVLAHGGGTTPAQLEGLLARHPNLVVDLSGMHFQRTPALATETGPLDPVWKALLEKRPDRFVIGIDVWAPRLFEPAMLDRLMLWTRRILGELAPGTAERIAHRNAAALFRIE